MNRHLIIHRAARLSVLLLFGACCSLVFGSLCTGCSSFAMQPPTLADQRVAASAVGVAANEALPLLVAEYERAGAGIVEASDSEADTRARLAVLDGRWNLVWQAHEAVQLAQHSWARALDSDGDTAASLGALEAAWCRLQRVWPAEVTPIPLELMGCNPEAP